MVQIKGFLRRKVSAYNKRRKEEDRFRKERRAIFEETLREERRKQGFASAKRRARESARMEFAPRHSRTESQGRQDFLGDILGGGSSRPKRTVKRRRSTRTVYVVQRPKKRKLRRRDFESPISF